MRLLVHWAAPGFVCLLLLLGCPATPPKPSPSSSPTTVEATPEPSPRVAGPSPSQTATDRVDLREGESDGTARLSPRLHIVTHPDFRLPRLGHPRYSPDGGRLLIEVSNPDGDNHLLTLELKTWKFRAQPLHRGRAGPLFSPDGTTLATPSGPNTIRLSAPGEKGWEATLGGDDGIRTMAFSPNGRLLAVARQSKKPKSRVELLNLETRKVQNTFELPGPPVEGLEFSPQSNSLLMRSGITHSNDGQTFKLHLGDVDSGALVASLDTETNFPTTAVFSKDGKTIYYSRYDNIVEERTLPELKPGRTWTLPLDADVSNIGVLQDRLKIDLVNVRESESDFFNLPEGVVLFDPDRGISTHQFIGATLSRISPDGSVLWLLDERHRFQTLRLHDQQSNPQKPPREFTHPLTSGQSWGTSSWVSLHSPESGDQVTRLQVLEIGPGSVEWVAWTTDDDFAGSPNWEKFATAVWRGEGRKKSQNLKAVVRAFERPGTLEGAANRPKTYAISPAVSRGEPEAVRRLLDEVLEKPGAWNQMCSFPPGNPRTSLPLNGYSRGWAADFITSANFERLRDGRGAVLREISPRLLALKSNLVENAEALAKKLESKGKFSTSSRPAEPGHALETYLMIILDLNGVESLPALLEVEHALNQVALYRLPPEVLSWGETKYSPVRYLEHTQVLSVITALLSSEGVDLTELEQSPRYDQEHRDHIIELAERFLKTTPPKDYRRASAMEQETSYR